MLNYHTSPIPFEPVAEPAAVVHGPQVRFTVLTDRLLRMEYSPTGQFEDRPSQVFWYRRQPAPAFELRRSAEQIEILTAALHLRYRITAEGFRPETLSVTQLQTGAAWRLGDVDRRNLRGTARTLDEVDGAIPLEAGLLSRSGWALVDDSRSLVFDRAGWLEERGTAGNFDLYFFGYGQDYTACLRDYCRVAGRVPLPPRWALGNWWSRYWAYRQDELVQLVSEFRRQHIPLAVCIIDMDWHIVQTGNRSVGWTGYTWNRELFPDPEGFLTWLHEQGVRTALNLHPADGVHPHEAAYPQMAAALGLDPTQQEPVRFDIADTQFTEAYFRLLHHPLEEAGVDFWWMDWQQGERIRHSRNPVAAHLDPLWWLNHLHFYDLGSDGKRPFIFSRWGGLGNHRYPIGFSGDMIVSWASLAFQPYFTATAGNVAFGWWSHDIGGHFRGVEDGELYTRWLQFGVFSPVMRLHCTKNAYVDRAPWAFGAEVLAVARRYLQLRHALIPYLYSMSWRFNQSGVPLVAPLYYRYPQQAEAYHCREQYLFGSEMLVAPFVTPADAQTGLSRAMVWLPEGRWYQFFSGEALQGGRWVAQYGTLEEMPVFVRAGGIVPLGPQEGGGVDNPVDLHLRLYAGADGDFDLYEDDGVSQAYLHGGYSCTQLRQRWQENRLVFTAQSSGALAHLPGARRLHVSVWGAHAPQRVQLWVNGQAREVGWRYDAQGEVIWLAAAPFAPGDEVRIEVEAAGGSLLAGRDRRLETCRRLLKAFRMNSWDKTPVDNLLEQALTDAGVLDAWRGALGDARYTALVSVLKG